MRQQKLGFILQFYVASIVRGRGDRNWLACVGKSDPRGDATRHAG